MGGLSGSRGTPVFHAKRETTCFKRTELSLCSKAPREGTSVSDDGGHGSQLAVTLTAGELIEFVYPHDQYSYHQSTNTNKDTAVVILRQLSSLH